ncbi:MAG: hypothetical protein ABSG36_14800 [Acidimicrobiales bacterium]|jgi:hypothetical protein
MPAEEDYVRVILPDPPPATSADRNAVIAAVLSDLDSSRLASRTGRRRRQSQVWTHRLVVVGVGALILAVFFVPLPRTSLFGRLDQAGSSGPRESETLAGSSSATTAKGFALGVLNKASTPPHARLDSKDVSGSLGKVFEGGPMVEGLVDLHRFYVVDELAGAAEAYVETHLPKGAAVTISTSGGTAPTGGSEGYSVSLPVSGPHEYLAWLAYYFQPVGTGGDETEIRIDSQTVWEPSRSVGELAPAGGIVEVTGFSQTGGANPLSVPVTFQLNRKQARVLRAAFNALPLGPPASCGVTQDLPLYRIVFRSTTRSATLLGAEAGTCTPADVVVTTHGSEWPSLYDRSCSLLRAVVAVLPAGKADTTRHAVGCRTR